MDEKTTSDPITRRAFAQRSGVAALVPIVVGLPHIAPSMAPEAETGPTGRRAGAPQEIQEDEEPPGVDAPSSTTFAPCTESVSPIRTWP